MLNHYQGDKRVVVRFWGERKSGWGLGGWRGAEERGVGGAALEVEGNHLNLEKLEGAFCSGPG